MDGHGSKRARDAGGDEADAQQEAGRVDEKGVVPMWKLNVKLNEIKWKIDSKIKSKIKWISGIIMSKLNWNREISSSF